jgi:penicillin-binding protein 2
MGRADVKRRRLTETTDHPGPSSSGMGGSPMTPKSAKRIAAFGTVIVVLFGILVVRLWFLQVVGATGFEEQAVGNSVRTIHIPAPRGQILDRNGQILAGSRLAVDIVALPQDLDGEGGDRTLRKLARVIGERPTRLRALMRSGQKNAPYKSVVLKADIDDDLLIPLNERIREFPGIRLERNFRRSYPFNSYLSHVLGHVGPIPAEEIDSRLKQGYRRDAIVGREGLEARYEEFLKGTDGERLVEVDASGNPAGRGVLSERPARSGLTLRTTVDINVQKALEDSLREQVELKSQQDAGGGGVVLDVNTGEVVAMASYPVLDPRVYTRGRRSDILKFERNPRKVHLDRAMWAFPPASTFKTITAVAALNAGYITPDEFLTSPKTVTLFGTAFNNFRKIELPDMQIRRALAMSSDTFFFQVGARLISRAARKDQIEGNTKLKQWALDLGLGQPTGIDIPGELAGVVPDRAWKAANIGKKERAGDQWRRGDTINMSVGQGFLKATPLQMARAYAALVNGGRLLQPSIGWGIADPTSGRLITDLSKGRPETHTPEFNPGVLEAVRGGLYDVANTGDGTAAPVFSRLGGLVAGKTGTAENPPRRDHSWFVGYGPANGAAPKYVVAIIIENAGLGTGAAAPAACKTLAAALLYDPRRCGAATSGSFD